MCVKYHSIKGNNLFENEFCNILFVLNMGILVWALL